MKNWTGRLFAILLLIATSTSHANDCQSHLLDNAAVVQIDVSSLSAIDATYFHSYKAIEALLFKQSTDADTAKAVLDVLWQNFYSLWNMHTQHLEQKNSEKIKRRFEASKQLFAVSAESTLSYDDAYKSQRGLHLYQRYFSAMQSYFSGIFITYGVVRSGFSRDSRPQVLELGPGIGDSTRIIRSLLPQARIFALDKSAVALNSLKAQGTRAIPIEQDFKLPLPFANNEIDMVVSIAATSQYMDIIEFQRHLKEVFRILSPGGYYLFEFGPTSRAFPAHLPLDTAVRILSAQGFQIEKSIDLFVRTKSSTYVPLLIRKPYY